MPETLGRYIRAAHADNTWRTYRAQWRRFAAWCETRGCSALPAEPITVAEYLAQCAQAGAAIASINVSLAAVRFVHGTAGLASGLEHPVIALALKGIRRRHLRPQHQAEALSGALLRQVLSRLTATPADQRDGALLAILYQFGLRASETVALDWEAVGRGRGWLRIGQDRAELVLLGSKAAPDCSERVVIPTAPSPLAFAAIARWIAWARILSGTPLLRPLTRGGSIGHGPLHAGSIGAIVKRALARHFVRAGLCPAAALRRAARFGGHSGRVGLCVAATEAGVAPQQLARVMRHASLAMLRRYAEQADMLKSAPHDLPGVGV
jgi:integrase